MKKYKINAPPAYVKAVFKGVKRSELNTEVELATLAVLKQLEIVDEAKKELKTVLEMYHATAHRTQKQMSASEVKALTKLRSNLIILFDK